MSLFIRGRVWWCKFGSGRKAIQESSGTTDEAKAQEYHDKRQAELWELKRLGVKPRRSWVEAVVKFVAETEGKRSHKTDLQMLGWLHTYLGDMCINDILLIPFPLSGLLVCQRVGLRAR